MTNGLELQLSEIPTFTCHPLDLLDSFLTDLESKALASDRKEVEILRVADFLLGPSILEGALNILDSPSAIRLLQSPHRTAFLVREKESYYCSNEIVYCSCQSFLERAKVDARTICKHLLAIKLMTHLDLSPVKELVSDAEFGRIVMMRVFVE